MQNICLIVERHGLCMNPLPSADDGPLIRALYFPGRMSL